LAGIASFGAYIPWWRLGVETREWGSKAERSVASFDEDSLTMAVAAAVNCLTGVDRQEVDGLYFATLGRPAVGEGSAHFLSPRLFDKQGNSVGLELDGPMAEGKVDARAGWVTELTIDGTTHRGFAISPGEVGFKLDGKYERLEVFVCYRPERGLPPYAAVDCRPVFAGAMECRQVREALWDLVARDFRDRQSQIEMEMERRDGIWNEYTPTGSEAPRAYYLARAQERLELARKTLAFVEQTVPRPKLAAELKTLEQRIDRAAEDPASSAGKDLFAQAVDLRRRIIFVAVSARGRTLESPVDDLGIAVTRRPLFFADVHLHTGEVLAIRDTPPGSGWGTVPTPVF